MASRLYLSSVTLPSAAVGHVNPLPPLFRRGDLHDVAAAGDADDEMMRGIGYGRVSGILPYLMQDGYDRAPTDTEHEVAVLENDHLRATFLLGAGGRLISLVHRAGERELLFRNAAFTPANLALRGAWFSGGVEWNIGTIGHSPLTCEPLHAVRARHADGSPVLRLYEYERLRGVVFQIDAWLPEDSAVLFVHARIVNPSDETVPIYWWSNIAVPQTPDVRVIAPADAAWQFGYDRTVRRMSIPVSDGLDRTYPSRSDQAADYFFDIPTGERPWVTALDADGVGLAHVSTHRLRGRKLFLWGEGRGGRHWQQWLNGRDQSYLEIQAGLARTQLEHLPLPGRSTWSWVEAYGLLQCPADEVHSPDWAQARGAVRKGIDALVPPPVLEEVLAGAADWVDRPPTEMLAPGSGWGALERIARSRSGDDSLVISAAPFPDNTIGPEQQPWLDLLNHETSLSGEPDEPPASYQIDARWAALLETASGWRAALHRGVVHAARDEADAAAAQWAASVHQQPNAWAHRNLGALAQHRGDLDSALSHYRSAHELAPNLLALTLELLDVLIGADETSEALGLIAGLPEGHRRSGRVRLSQARAALAAGDLSTVAAVLRTGIEIADIREGETSLTAFWDAYQDALVAADPTRSQRDPLPHELDFRMTGGD